VKVTRTVYKQKQDEKPTIETSYYISSRSISAKVYNQGIRSHWAIENSLHYVKDVTFREDASRIRTGDAPANFSLIRNIAINFLKRLDCISFKQAIRLFGGNIQVLAKLLE